MSEDIDFTPTTDGPETEPTGSTPESDSPRSETLKKRLTKLGRGVMNVLNIYARYTTGGLYNILPPGGGADAGPSPADEVTEALDEPAPAPEEKEEPDLDDKPEDTGESIEEDSPESLEEPARVEEYLRTQGVDPAMIEQVNAILERDQHDLIKEHLAAAGVEPENLEHVAHLLKPLHIYLKRLHELGMPPDKDGQASHFLHEEKGSLRLKHLEDLVSGETDKIRLLMRTHQSELLAKELRTLGYDEDKISRIAATPRLNKSRLINEALTRVGLERRLIVGVELTVAISEIPSEIAERAASADIPLEKLVKAREAFRRAEWGETFDYLELAKTDPGARELLKSHGIEIEPAPETDGARRERLETMSLKEINEKYPDEWEAERDRRVDRNRREFFKMLERFKDYLPLDDFPLPPDVEVPPEESIPEDFPGAYGLWRRVVTDNYARLLATGGGYQEVRSEIKRVGGPPIVRRLGQKNMARKVLAGQRGRDREIGSDKDYGALGHGRERYLANLRAMQELDTRAANIRRALDKFHRSKFIKDGQATARLQLAEAVVEHKLKEIAYRGGRLDLMPPQQVKIPTSSSESDDETELSGEGMV